MVVGKGTYNVNILIHDTLLLPSTSSKVGQVALTTDLMALFHA
jgi:hypothetical protein